MMHVYVKRNIVAQEVGERLSYSNPMLGTNIRWPIRHRGSGDLAHKPAGDAWEHARNEAHYEAFCWPGQFICYGMQLYTPNEAAVYEHCHQKVDPHGDS